MTDPTSPPAAPAHPVRRRRATGAGLIPVIGSLTLLPAVSTDMYLPSLPDVASDLSTTTGAVGLTITGMLIGGSLGQLLVGPISDRFGRRLPALVGISLHVVISLLCTQVTGVGQLTALRVLQGLAASGGTVVAMAVVRDQFTGARAARLLSRLMLIIGVAPLLAPTVGGVVAEHWGWRAVFVTLAVMGLVIGTVVLLFLPETLPPERRAGRGPREAFRGYAGIARDRRFVALAVIPGLGMGVVIGYVAGSSFVFQQEYHLDKTHFAVVFAVIGVAQVVTAQVNAAVVPRVGPLRILRLGLPFGLTVGAGLLAVALTGVGGLPGLVVMLWFTMASLGFISANASALAISRHGERAGSAAAVMGFLQGALGGSIGSLTGALGGSSVAMAGVMVGSLTVGVVVLASGTAAYRRGGWLSDVTPVHTPAPAGRVRPTLAP